MVALYEEQIINDHQINDMLIICLDFLIDLPVYTWY